MTAKPADFEPLAASDPVPGNTDEIAALGKRYTDTAAEIAREAAGLRKLASQAPDGWKGQAGTVFASKATDLASRIVAAEKRYAAAGRALTAAANPMYEAQQQAYAAVDQAKGAQQQLSANAPGPARPAGSPPLTAEQQQASRTRAAAYSSASDSLTAARTNFDNAVSDYKGAVSSAVGAINNAIGSDGLKDSWWDRNFGWISKVFTYIAIAVIVLAIVALIIACPFSATLLAAIGLDALAGALGTIGSILGWTLFVLTVLQAVYDGIAAGTGKESWTAFIFDVVAIVTFGFGKGAEAIAKGLTGFSEGAAKAVAAGRAGRAAMSADGLPGFLYSLASRSSLVESVLNATGKGAGAFTDAANAAEEAVKGVETALKAAKPANASVLLTMSSEMSAELSKLAALGDQVPGVVRIAVPRTVTQGLAAIDGVFQWGSFLSGGVFTLHGIATGG